MITPNRLLPLDGLRGLFAISVAYLHQFGINVVPGGYLAVDFFFILSGFVLSYVYVDRVCHQQYSFKRFFKSRIARLYPLHLLTMFLAFVAGLIHIHVETGSWQNLYYLKLLPYSFFTNILLIHNIGFDKHHAFNGVSWSISVELWVNFLLFYLWRIKGRVLVMFLLALGGYLLLFYYVGKLKGFKIHIWHIVPNGLIRGIAGICLGYLVYMFCSKYSEILKKIVPTFLAEIIFACSILGTLWIVFITKTGYTDFFAPIFSVIMIACSVIFPFTWVSRLFSIKFFVFLGTISYSVYLVHPILIRFLNAIAGGRQELRAIVWANPYLYAVAYGILVIMVSTVLYYYFEKPMKKYLNRKLGSKEA